MLSTNPFAALTAFISPAVIQGYVIVMAVLVAAGTLFDIVHKASARYFFENWRAARRKGRRPTGSGEVLAAATRTVAVDVLTSGEFCNPRRRIAHLLTMYGFLLYVIPTAVMVFAYPTPADPAPAILPQLWHLGAAMICIGGYWFWFFIRVDVAAEGNSPLRVVHADLFVLSLLASATLALVWSFAQSAGSAWANVILGLYVLATTVLFAGVPWSKFAHMFYKPAAAFEKRMAEANGSRSNLPEPADRPEVFGSARELPRHY
jgi:hypothetical protein